MQLPVAIAFGFMIDFAVWLLDGIHYSSYLMQWLFCIVGIVMVAAGVSMEVTANVVTLAGEGLVLAVCKVAPVKFSSMTVSSEVPPISKKLSAAPMRSHFRTACIFSQMNFSLSFDGGV